MAKYFGMSGEWGFQLVVFNNDQKMALRALYLVKCPQVLWKLELRQYKNNSDQFHRIPRLKLPPFSWVGLLGQSRNNIL